MICSSPATISSSTRTCAASCWKCPTPPLDPNGSAYGRARWTARAGFGSRRTGARYPRKAVFLVGSEREAYLAGEPANDARFIAVFAHALEHAGGYAPEEARRVA